ncbi:MAG: hypothetical protein IKR23_01875 [Lachnospiraceae bacterium]|nr:hypothetical protein [Lachnospiraceae bacterium]
MIKIDKNDPKNDPLLAALVGVGIIVTFTAMIAVYGVPFHYKPAVMIGEEGLQEIRKYLHFLLLCQALVLVGLPALYVIFGVVYHKIRHIPLRPLYVVGYIVAGLLFSLTVVPIRLSGVEAQSRRFKGDNLLQVIRLLDAVNKDMDAEPVVVCEDEEIYLLKLQHSHSYATSKGRPSSIWEYELIKRGGSTICQVTAGEYQELKPVINSLAGYTVRCYPNSGLLYDINGGAELLTEDEILASIYTITYDNDGYIRWEGPSADVELYNLGMNYYMDGELRLSRNAEGRNVDDPLFFDGRNNSAYLTAVYNRHYRRVSNILEVTDVIETPFGDTPSIPTDTPGVYMALEKDPGHDIEMKIPEDYPADGQDTEKYDAVRDGSQDDGTVEWEPDPEVKGSYFITADELLIKDDSPYYSEIMNAIDALADAPEITVGSEFKRWTPVSRLSFKHSDGDTDFVVYMNTDMDKYEDTPQSEADVYFRISGKIHGEKIDRYVVYDPELRTLWDAQEKARN